MSNRITVWNFLSYPLLERAGGPSTYLYNLREGIRAINSNSCDVFFVYPHTYNTHNPSNYFATKTKVFKKILKKILKDNFPKFIAELSVKKALQNIKREQQFLVDKINKNKGLNILHFHSPFDIYSFQKFFRTNLNSEVIILYTQHTPESYQKEFIKFFFERTESSEEFVKFTQLVAEIELEAFSIADFIVLPCPEVVDIYKSEYFDNKIYRIIENKPKMYVPTGILPVKRSSDSIDVLRKKYHIPADATVVSYIGRHDYIKGFDLLKESAKLIWENNPNVYFLIAGKESPILGLKNDYRWIELGWINNITDVLAVTDVLVLPNRSTFFDLIALEAMSAGKPIIASKTGGNIFLSNYSKGVILFEKLSNENLAYKVIDTISKGREYLKSLGDSNNHAYNTFFRAEIFAQNYIQTLLALFEK